MYWADGTISQVTARGLERLPREVEEQLRAELHDLHVLDRAAAPDPEDVIATMRANGLHDPECEP